MPWILNKYSTDRDYQNKNKNIAIYAPINDIRPTVHNRLKDTSRIGLIMDVSKENF